VRCGGTLFNCSAAVLAPVNTGAEGQGRDGRETMTGAGWRTPMYSPE
jgi:hypothetical protein